MINEKYKRLIETDSNVLPKKAIEMNYVFLANCSEMKLDEYYRNFDKLLELIEQLEKEFGKIIITSAFRSVSWELYKKRHGRSYHAFGRAFDFCCTNLPEAKKWLKNKIETKELIYYNSRNFIHVAL